jgi:DNA repair protein RecO (recombination protein O)
MNQLVTQGIILSRTDFGEADRIITLLTPDHGKLRLLAKGVRRVKSKLAGGIELFSVSSITFVKGRGEIGTLVSTRLFKHYAHIVTNLERTLLGYEFIKRINKVTEDQPEAAYFELLNQSFAALDDLNQPLSLIALWFELHLLELAGHTLNLQTDDQGKKLDATQTYNFNFDRMAFGPAPNGRFQANHIKLLRLVSSRQSPAGIARIQQWGQLAEVCLRFLEQLR